MANSVDLKKTVYNKEHFNKVVNKDFTTFVNDAEEPTLTIEEFFQAYNNLYFSINIEGEENSHRFLVNKSSELLTFDSTTNQYQALLDEIASLRERLLISNENIVRLQSQLLTNNIKPVLEQEPDLEVSTTSAVETTEESESTDSTEGSRTSGELIGDTTDKPEIEESVDLFDTGAGAKALS